MAETIEGVVTNVNDTGLKLQGHEDWFNYSKPEYREGAWDAHGKGDTVKLVVNGKFIASIQRTGGTETPAPETEHSLGSRERAIDYNAALKVAGDIYAAAITQGFVQAVPGASEVTAYAKALMSD